MTTKYSLWAALLTLSLTIPQTILAADIAVGRVVNLTGSVLADRPQKGEQGVTLHTNDLLFEGDIIKTISQSTTDLLIHDSLVSLSADSEFSITSATVPKKPIFELIKGRLRAMICKVLGDKEIVLTTPNAVIGIRGTMVDIAYTQEVTWVCPLADGDPSLLHFAQNALAAQKRCEVLEVLRTHLKGHRTPAATERIHELSQQIERCWEKFQNISRLGGQMIEKIDGKQTQLEIRMSKIDLTTLRKAEEALDEEIPTAKEVARWRKDLGHYERSIASHKKSIDDLSRNMRTKREQYELRREPLEAKYESLLAQSLKSARGDKFSPYIPDLRVVKRRADQWRTARELLKPLKQQITALDATHERDIRSLTNTLAQHEEMVKNLEPEQEALSLKIERTQQLSALLGMLADQLESHPVTSLASSMVKGMGAQASVLLPDQANRAIASTEDPVLEKAANICEESRKRLRDLKNALECMAIYQAKMKKRLPAGMKGEDWERKCDDPEYIDHPERRPSHCGFLEAARDCSSLEAFNAVVTASTGPSSSSLFSSSASSTFSEASVSSPTPALADSVAPLAPLLSPDTNIAIASLIAETDPSSFYSESPFTPESDLYLQSLIPIPICF